MDDSGDDDVPPRATVGDVLAGPLLGPVMGLAFSTGGDLLFSCSGSSLRVYDVRSGAPLSATRVFSPGVTVYGIDVGRESCECKRRIGWSALKRAGAAAVSAAVVMAVFAGVFKDGIQRQEGPANVCGIRPTLCKCREIYVVLLDRVRSDGDRPILVRCRTTTGCRISKTRQTDTITFSGIVLVLLDGMVGEAMLK